MKNFDKLSVANTEFESKIKRIAKENLDLSSEFIKNILISQEEVQAGKLELYSFLKSNSQINNI